MLDIYRDPIWEMMDFFANPFERKVTSKGLSNIHKPHNLTNVKDDKGNIVAQKLTVVTTPFKKDDVSVKIAGDVLSVRCGSENVEDAENEDVVYRGISSQAYQFELKLGECIDKSAIKAENKDGLLTISLPYVVEEEKKPEEIEIKVD
jgi:HSP20 family molecular chaperone IbpA